MQMEKPSETETPALLSGRHNSTMPSTEVSFSAAFDWDATRDSGIRPLHVSEYSTNEEARKEFLLGVSTLRLKKLPPQSLTIADVLNHGDETVVICIPRRSSKTTSVFATLIGRMMSREDYTIGFTAQSQVKARKRIIDDLIRPLERQYDKHDDGAPFKWGIAAGNTYLEYVPTGSRITALPPTEDAARGDTYDCFVVDESQEVDAPTWESIAGAIYPVFDTVETGGQLIALGTAGQTRSGMLWSLLETGREGEAAIVEYAADPDVEIPEDGQDPIGTTADEAVWLTAHPGVGTLTTLEVLRRRHAQLTPESWAREYLGIWPQGAGSRLLDGAAWEGCRYGAVAPALPKDWVLAIAVDPDNTRGSIIAVWRDGTSLAHMTLLDSRPGSDWMQGVLRSIYAKHKKPIVWDSMEANTKNVVDSLGATGRVRNNPQRFPQVAAAAQLLTREIKARRVRHYSQDALDMAVAHTVKRSTSDRWLFGSDDRANQEANITAIQAAALALRVWDERPPTTKRSLGAVLV